MSPQFQFTPEQVEQQVRALGDSIHLINTIIAEGVTDAETRDRMDRNVRHLQIMLGYDHIKNSGADLSPSEGAIAAGTAWLQANGG